MHYKYCTFYVICDKGEEVQTPDYCRAPALKPHSGPAQFVILIDRTSGYGEKFLLFADVVVLACLRPCVSLMSSV